MSREVSLYCIANKNVFCILYRTIFMMCFNVKEYLYENCELIYKAIAQVYSIVMEISVVLAVYLSVSLLDGCHQTKRIFISFTSLV